MGLLPCNVLYDLIPSWADNYVIVEVGLGCFCVAGRSSRVFVFVLWFVPLLVSEAPDINVWWYVYMGYLQSLNQMSRLSLDFSHGLLALASSCSRYIRSGVCLAVRMLRVSPSTGLAVLSRV